jgi:uncharacterized protein YlaI
MMVECMVCDGRYWLEENDITTQIVINKRVIGYLCDYCGNGTGESFTTQMFVILQENDEDNDKKREIMKEVVK